MVARLSAPLTDLASQLHVVGSSLASTTTTEADPTTALPHILKGIDDLQQTVEQCDARLQQALHSLDQRTALLRVDGDILAGQFPRMSCSLAAWHHAHPVTPTRPSSVSATPSNRAQSAPTASLLSTPMQGPRGTPPSLTHGPVPQCTPPLNVTDSLPASPTQRSALPHHSTSSCLEGSACSAGVKAYLSQFADWAPSASLEGRGRPDAPPFLLDGDDEEGTAEGVPLPTRPNLRRTVDAMLLRELQYDGITLTAEMERQLSGEVAEQDFQDRKKPHAGRVGDGAPVRVSSAIERGKDTDPASLYQDLRHGVFTPSYTPNVAASTAEGGVVRCHLQAHFPRLVTWLERVAAEDGSDLPLEEGHSNAFERDETGALVSSCIELSQSTTPAAGDGPGSPLQPGSMDSRPRGPSWSGHNSTRLDSVEECAEEAMSLPPVRPAAREVSDTATATSPFMSPAEVEESGHSILDYSYLNFQTYVEDPGWVPGGEVSQEQENTTPIGVSVGDSEATRRALPSRLRVHCNAVRRAVRSHTTTLLADLAVLTLLQELTSIVGCRCHAAGADEDALLSSMKAATGLFHAFHHDPWLVELLSQRTPAVSGMKADGNEETSWQSDISRLSSPQRLLCYEHIITALGYVPLVPALQRHSPTDMAPSLNCLHFLDTVAPFLTLWGCRPTELIAYRSRPPPPSHSGSRLPFSATVAPQVWLASVCTSLLNQVYHLNRLVYLLHRMEDTDVAAVGETLGEWHDRMDNLRRTVGSDAARPEYPENGLTRWVLPFSQCILQDLAVWEASGLLKASSPSMSARRSCPSATTAEPLAPVGVESLELPSAEGTGDETREVPAPSEAVNAHAPLVRQLSRDSSARERRRAEPVGLWTGLDFFARNRDLAGAVPPPPPTGVSTSTGVEVMGTNAIMLELPHASEILISRDARLRRSDHADFFQPPSRSSASPAADLPYPEGPPPGYYAAGPCLCSSPTSGELVRWQFSFRATMCYCLVSRHRCIDPLVSGALLMEPWRQPTDETLPQATSQLRHPDAPEQVTAAAVRRADMARLLATLPSPSDGPVADVTHISFAPLGDGEGNEAGTSHSLSSLARPVSVQLLTRNLSDPLCSTHSARLNPPDLLSCGHVLSHTELQRLSRMQQRSLHARQRHAIGSPPPPLSVRCPYCARETSLPGVLTLSYIY